MFDFIFHPLRHVQRTGQHIEQFFRLLLKALHQPFHIAHHIAGQVFGQGAHIGGNRHFVIVKNHQQVDVHITGVVERFKCLPGSHGAIADNRHAAAAVARQFVGHCHA